MKSNKGLLFLKNKVVLVTGGTGSFGRNFVKYLHENSEVRKIIVFSRDEFKQFELNEEINDEERTRFFLGDIRDKDRLLRAFHGVDIVVHAAALKQVPTLEYNPFEAVKTNIIGTQNVIEAAIDCGVEKVLLISTDKAAEPVNLYGATKLCAEKLFVSANAYSGNRAKFSAVRYGNVMGSRGSIIDKLLKISEKSEICVTHEEMTRFWLNLSNSFELVLFALKNMMGGEIFVPKIASMKLMDIFEVLAPRAKKKITGIRPGEKLHEVLVTKEESRHSIELEKHYVILPEREDLFANKDRYAKIYKGSKKLPANFEFASDSNSNWMAKEQFKDILFGSETKRK